MRPSANLRAFVAPVSVATGNADHWQRSAAEPIQHRYGCGRPRRWIGLCVAALACLFATTPAVSQPLPASCPNGGPNYTPFGMSQFLPGDTGTPMLRHTLSDPASICNDGSPAILYLRPATAYYSGPALAPHQQWPERWVIFFDGGGGCGSADECLERWCGISGFDRAGKMSTLGAYDAIPGNHGIFRRDPAINHFAGYNHVILHYCSSDSWIGSETHSALQGAAGPSYDIEFQGEAIVRDAFRSLVAGVGPDPLVAQTFWSDPLPSLLSAEEIVLVGESAGGNGLRHHADRIRNWLLGQMAPETRIVAVVDAGAPVALYDPAITWGNPLAVPGAPADYTDFLQNWATPRIRTFWGADNSALDASCLDPAWAAAHNAIGSHPDICLDTTYTLFEHITTPLFLRQDLSDPLSLPRYADWALVPDLPTFQALQYAQSTAVPSHIGLEAPLAARGVFGPKCDRHVSIQNDTFFTHTTRPAAAGLSFHDLLVNWLLGVGPSSQVQWDFNPGPVYTPSICP